MKLFSVGFPGRFARPPVLRILRCLATVAVLLPIALAPPTSPKATGS